MENDDRNRINTITARWKPNMWSQESRVEWNEMHFGMHNKQTIKIFLNVFLIACMYMHMNEVEWLLCRVQSAECMYASLSLFVCFCLCVYVIFCQKKKMMCVSICTVAGWFRGCSCCCSRRHYCAVGCDGYLHYSSVEIMKLQMFIHDILTRACRQSPQKMNSQMWMDDVMWTNKQQK